MDPLTAGIVTGGLSIVGTKFANDGSAKQAQDQMKFQERMSSTAHQREVEDLRAAGLNPMLSALGSGASSPGGASGSVNDFAPGISKGAETALGLKSLNKEVDLKDQTIDNMRDEAFNIKATRKKIEADTTGTKLANDQTGLQNQLLKETMPHAIKEAKAKGDWSQVNQIMGILSSGASTAADAASILSPLKIKLPSLGKTKK